jgi:hypothetical protein
MYLFVLLLSSGIPALGIDNTVFLRAFPPLVRRFLRRVISADQKLPVYASLYALCASVIAARSIGFSRKQVLLSIMRAVAFIELVTIAQPNILLGLAHALIPVLTDRLLPAMRSRLKRGPVQPTEHKALRLAAPRPAFKCTR